MRRAKLVVAVLAAVLGPVIVLWGQAQRQQPHGDLKIDCGECHVPERWTPVEKPPSFRHAATGFALEGAHARTSCRNCHRSLVFTRVGTACADCHGDVHRGELGPRCEACHAPTESWTNQREIFRAHYGTRFPLMAVHARLDCAACHKAQRPYEYKNTPAECGSCHYQDYLSAANPNHVQVGFSRRCEDCHLATANSWHEANFSHPAEFPLVGGHANLVCARCHGSGTPRTISADCVSCHQKDYASATNPPHSGFPTTCQSCHTIQAWRPAKFDHGTTGFPLTGAHVNVDCNSCHAGGRFQGTPKDCYSCHQAAYNGTTDPNHKAAGFPTACQNCHTTSSWQGGDFSHNKFPLTGAHASVACSKCHTSGFAGTPSDCFSCHQANYNSTTNPNHVASSFPKDCQVCHSTTAWQPAAIDHSKTRFPLTGAHVSVACATCHIGGRYTGTPTDCWSCHQSNYNGTTNPNHAASNFPHQCEVCHSTRAWQPASFDHSKTRFPLTGAHASVACTKCHINGQYTGTPTDCYSCHQADYAGTTNPNHQAAGFPTTCKDCHNTTAWNQATFDHDGLYFPIYSGTHRGRWSSCNACHVNPANYAAFECILCHPHSDKAQTDSNHNGVSGYVYASAACYQCHPRGRAGNAPTTQSPRKPPRRRP